MFFLDNKSQFGCDRWKLFTLELIIIINPRRYIATVTHSQMEDLQGRRALIKSHDHPSQETTRIPFVGPLTIIDRSSLRTS